eukprot:CAMPEP_0194224172 /NCGR_PEP_ID=MMETSP0156-20130528/36838_1 /TAXON_ID=33649 /ORGANISM="Thalassionema nitzschioides, Strain L26-B" /LENGTH=1801 /DNA_ID=CAMNT_0038955611 /DNA_START=80 /DNA_END=5485 /DNA_ORIENTATION=-
MTKQGYNGNHLVLKVKDEASTITNNQTNESQLIDSDVEIIDSIEWADPSNIYASNELAPRPRFQIPDACGCYVDRGQCCKDESCVLYACQEECYECLDECCNQRITKKQWKKVEVIEAGPKGKGLKVLENIKKGNFIIEYVGRAVQKAYLDRLFSRYKTERCLYIMALDGSVLIDARVRGGVARYINHSCEPNCVVQRWKVKGLLRAGIFASRDINAGEELSFDYKWERRRGRAATKCHCGSSACRGTLEVAKSMEEEELERQCRTHWCKPPPESIGVHIMNRTIRIYSEQHHEYFAADVCRYDEKQRLHLVMYRSSLEEAWEDLMKETWELLDEEAEQFVIAKKKRVASNQEHHGFQASPQTNASNNSLVPIPSSAELTNAVSMRDFVNYFYVATEMKNQLDAKGFIANVGRRFGCSVKIDRFSTPEFPSCADEQTRRQQVLETSPDGIGWKLIISGSNLEKACGFLGNYISRQENSQLQRGTGVSVVNTTGSGDIVNLSEIKEEVIIPRCAVDLMKNKLPGVRERCRNVDFQFAPSESKSKHFARIQLQGSLASDLKTAKEHLWSVIIKVCDDCEAPKTASGFYKDLGYLGGQLSPSQFQLLLNKNDSVNNRKIEQQSSSHHLHRQEAHEDLRQQSFFFASFESTHRCSIWVQSETDMGRVEQNRVVSEYDSSVTPRMVYFACDDIATIPKLWTLVEQRAKDKAKGIRFFHLGPDRMYQQLMIQNSGRFFEYLKQVTGALVSLDSITGDHLRIDGGNAGIDLGDWNSEQILTPSNIACLAEELIRIQIEIYRDHCIRQQKCMFGRDWSIAAAVNHNHQTKLDNSSPDPKSLRMTFKSCLEVAKIVHKAEMTPSVGAHAAVIMYRFLKACPSPVGFKQREVTTACLFLADKAEKAKKWKKLDALLEIAYPVFFPGSKFHHQKQEAINFHHKVLAAETEILSSLQYDICWGGVEWIIRVAEESGHMAQPQVQNVIDVVLSGPVLAAGADLWLKYGTEYIFTAVAGFLDVDMEPLFEALSLIPLKVSHAAQLIADSVEANGISRKLSGFDGGKEAFLGNLKSIQRVCMVTMAQSNFRQQSSLPSVPKTSVTSMRYQLVGQLDMNHMIFQKISSVLLNKLLPQMNAICAESQCRFYVSLNTDSVEGSHQIHDLVLMGSWRALSIASHLLAERCAENDSLPTPTTISFFKDHVTASHRLPCSKSQVGLLSMKDVSTLDGWEGTVQATTTTAQTNKIGGKACMAGRVPVHSLRTAGLRWWNQDFVSSPSAALYEIPCLQERHDEKSDSGDDTLLKKLRNLSKLAVSFLGKDALNQDFPNLSLVLNNGGMSSKVANEEQCSPSFWAVSMQRWPPEKIGNREQRTNSKTDDVTSSISSLPSLTGFSPSALQELQLLTQLHSRIPSPWGHPNFPLPIGVAVPPPPSKADKSSTPASSEFGKAKVEDMFSLFRSSEENERNARKKKKRQDIASGPHLVFSPTPFLLTRILQLSSKKRRDASTISKEESRKGDSSAHCIPSVLLASWFHDLLSALVHCHTNHVVLRSIQTDQLYIDHSGVIKLAGFYRATVLPPQERDTYVDPLQFCKSKKSKTDRQEDHEVPSPYAAPEILLGSLKYTKETDVWAIGSMVAHLLLGKPMFAGKERSSLLVAVCKIVGSPSEYNYPDAVKFPIELSKEYKRDVKRAFKRMMKPEDFTTHEKGAIDLISKMLHLDPKKRITAVDALQHDFFQNYTENCRDSTFQSQFVKEWLALKRELVLNGNDGSEKKRTLKRKAMLEAAAAADPMADSDDLYDMQDILESASSKKRRRD